MQQLKRFGLVGLMILSMMAIVGMANASAAPTKFCKVNEEKCSAANTYPSGTVFKAETVAHKLEINVPKVFKAAECNSTLEGKFGATPGEPLTGTITSSSWSSCTGPFGPWTSHGLGKNITTSSTAAGGGVGYLTINSAAEDPFGVYLQAGEVACNFTASTFKTALSGGSGGLAQFNAYKVPMQTACSLTTKPAELNGTWQIVQPAGGVYLTN
jgi:hypothetical protein